MSRRLHISGSPDYCAQLHVRWASQLALTEARRKIIHICWATLLPIAYKKIKIYSRSKQLMYNTHMYTGLDYVCFASVHDHKTLLCADSPSTRITKHENRHTPQFATTSSICNTSFWRYDTHSTSEERRGTSTTSTIELARVNPGGVRVAVLLLSVATRTRYVGGFWCSQLSSVDSIRQGRSAVTSHVCYTNILDPHVFYKASSSSSSISSSLSSSSSPASVPCENTCIHCKQ